MTKNTEEQKEAYAPGQTVLLPELRLTIQKSDVGEAVRVIRPKALAKIQEVESVNISPRVSMPCLVLDTCERFLISSRKNLTLEDKNIDGILLSVAENDSLRWLSHKGLDKIRNEIDVSGHEAHIEGIVGSWKNLFAYKAETPPAIEEEDYGLRPPQLGSLFAIGSHWSLDAGPATIVMPTGTGKTETMLAAVVASQIKRTLVVVPSKALRKQIVDKFTGLGLLEELGAIPPGTARPAVGVLKRRPKTPADLEFLRSCNVVVAVISSVTGGTAEAFHKDFAALFDLLIVDEAHHVAASSWDRLRTAFSNKKVLQFTATPFRNDEKLVDGAVIYSYPLKRAQEDGYFKAINFLPVHEIDNDDADRIVAQTAIARLRADIAEEKPHQLIARCKSVERAEEVFKYYVELASDLSPQLIHSELKDADERIASIRDGTSKVVVCVNMLGEGVDIPTLKVAAVHDKHQSLAVLLQFVGRITRKGGKNLGDASVVANIADPKISGWLERLYSEDADWNSLLREMSSNAAKEHAEFIKFLEASEPYEGSSVDGIDISQNSIRPTFSTLFFQCNEFHPKRFVDGLPDRYQVINVWINDENKTLYFVARLSENVKWSSAKEVEQIDWHLFVMHFDEESELLYLASTNKASSHDSLAKAVGAASQVEGEKMFRSLSGIGRLVFNNLGVTKHGRRNLSFAMYTGADVKQALSESEKKGSRKSNVSGYGWEDGKQITIGCSHKGRVWSKAAGTVPQFIEWVRHVGAKVMDNSIDTKTIIANVLIPEYADQLPEFEVLSIEWPVELLGQSEERVSISINGKRYDWFDLDLKFSALDRTTNTVTFSVVSGEDDAVNSSFNITPMGESGFKVITDEEVLLEVGKNQSTLVDFFSDYPPLIRFMDLSELDGNILLKSDDAGLVKIPIDDLKDWDWSGVDITKESIWKKGVERRDSIQWHTAQRYTSSGFDVVFDDDDAGEAADLVCLKEEEDHIVLELVHCKFSGGEKKGKRVKDAVEVASQAVRSARWPGHLKKLVTHLELREKRHKDDPKRSRFFHGDSAQLQRLLRSSRFKEVRAQVVIVQPGVSKKKITDDQSVVLGSASAYLKQTLGIDLQVYCSD